MERAAGALHVDSSGFLRFAKSHEVLDLVEANLLSLLWRQRLEKAMRILLEGLQPRESSRS
ncbi:MAG: hypothetical protein ACYCW6_19220 [Candidatus Xenobia bacterium]